MASPMMQGGIAQHQGGHAQHGVPLVIAQHAQPYIPSTVRNCVRLRGMPYSATLEDIMGFLGEASQFILPAGVHMVLNQQGRPSGDAFIQMLAPEYAARVALDVNKGGCHKKHMGERYVEVFQCSGDEMNLVLMGGTLNRNGVQAPPGMTLISTDIPMQQQGVFYAQAQPMVMPISPTPLMQSDFGGRMQGYGQAGMQGMQGIYAYNPYFPTPPMSPTATPLPANYGMPQGPQGQNGNGNGTQGGCQVKMQGLPFTAKVHEIMEFFNGFQLNPEQVKIIYNERCKPSGDAIVTFPTADTAQRAIQENQKKHLGNRYIELFVI